MIGKLKLGYPGYFYVIPFFMSLRSRYLIVITLQIVQ